MHFDKSQIADKITSSKSILSKPRGRQVLKAIASCENGITLREIQDELNLSYYKVYTTVNRLEDEHLIAHREGKKHAPGVKATYIYYPASGVMENLALLQDEQLNVQESVESSSTLIQSNVSIIDKSQVASLHPSNPLEKRLSSTRQTTRAVYLRILKTIADGGEVTMNSVSEHLQMRPQNVHAKLIKLKEFNVLERKAYSGEYKYRLSEDITPTHVEELIANSGIETIEYKQTTSEEGLKLMREPSDSTTHVSASFEQKTLAESLASKLPNFDPTWPQEVQAEWLKAYRDLIELQKSKEGA